MTSYTGLTSLNESSTSSLPWSAGVWRTKLRSSWASIALRLPLSAADIVTISQRASADCTVPSEDYIGRRSGTHYRPSFAICPSVLATLVARWRRYCSRDISALSAIEMLCIILRYTNFLFYSILFSNSQAGCSIQTTTGWRLNHRNRLLIAFAEAWKTTDCVTPAGQFIRQVRQP